MIRKLLLRLLNAVPAPAAEVAPAAPAVPAEPQRKGISAMAMAGADRRKEAASVLIEPYEPPPGVLPASISADAAMAMDSTDYDFVNSVYCGAHFKGYPYLALLSQYPEYRKMSETIAKQMTRKWIKVCATGDVDKADKVKAMEDALKKFKVRALFRKAAELDGFFGRGQIYIDVKMPGGGPARADAEELKTPLLRSPAKIKKDSLVGFKVIEPVWTYPNAYNSSDPLAPDYYKPTSWFVMGNTVHASRLLLFVSREVPDMLKASYNFGGLSMSQLAEPYVNNWLRTRDSVSDLVHSFSTSGVLTNTGDLLSGGDGKSLYDRADLFNKMRDNRGLMILDKDTEDFFQFNVPLSGVSDLQAQAQEQQSAVSNIPLVYATGITPKGLNATSEPEMDVFAEHILSMQESIFSDNLNMVFEVIQLSEFGAVDPDIGYEYEPLSQMDPAQAATIRKTDADTGAVLIGAGVISADDERERLIADPENGYHSLEANPELDDDPDDVDPEDADAPGAMDGEFREDDHPRDQAGRFGAGGTTGPTTAVQLKGDELGSFSSMKELRQKALSYADRFIGKDFTNASTGHSIRVTKSGVKHTISNSGDSLVRTIPAIPDLLEKSELVDSSAEKGGDPNILAVETYVAPLEIDGEKHRAVMTVKHYQDGRRYYDHGLVE